MNAVLPLHANPDFAGKIVTLKISNGARDQKDLPTRLKLLNWGVNSTRKGPVIVNDETAKLLPLNQKEQGFDRVAIDFNHQTVPGSDEYKRLIEKKGTIHPLPIAAYGTPVVIPGDGLWLENIEWTPEGEAHARNYHDLSPAPVPNKKGVVVMLHSVALCPQGAVDGLSFFSTSFIKPLNTMDTPTTDSTSSAVDYKGLLVSILQKLGVNIPDGASDSDIASMVDQFKAPAPAPKTGDAPAADDKKKDAAAAPDPTTMSAGERFLLGEIKKLQAGNDDSAKNALVLRASQEGKVLPLGVEEIKATPLNVLQVIVDKLPAGTVPLAAAQRGGGAGQVTTLTADEKLVCKTLGVSEEAFLKDKQANPTLGRLVTV